MHVRCPDLLSKPSTGLVMILLLIGCPGHPSPMGPTRTCMETNSPVTPPPNTWVNVHCSQDLKDFQFL